MRRLALAILATAALASCQDATQPVQPDLPTAAGAVDQPLERFIVVFHPGADDVPGLANRLAGAFGRAPSFVYQTALQGFAAQLPPAARAALERNPAVAYVEDDPVRSTFAQTVPTGIDRIFATGNANLAIDGVDERVDVDVAIIDTGIDFEHPDLNVVGGVKCSGGGPFGGSCSAGGDDDHYHGTHVAGTVAGLDNGIGVVGVAPGARLWAVKVLDQRGSGYASWIIAGIDWVAANASTIEVANMSLGGSGYSQGEYDAIQGAVDAGVAFAVSAGNSNADASNYSPAAFDNVLTVSALADFDGAVGGNGSPTCRSDQDDTLADFSNWGSAVDIAAPGVCTLSTFPIEKGEYGTISGTSMASPHVAGALALLASGNNPANATDVANLYDQVINAGNFNWTDDSGDGTKEPLLDVTGFTAAMVGGGDDTTDDAPSVSVTNPAGGATVSGTVAVTADASDDNGVTSVEFLVDGNSIGVDTDGSNGWSASWNTVDFSEGAHTVTARATDTANQTADASVTVTVDNVEDPVASITLSVNAYKVKGTQTADLTWTGATTNVDIYRDGTPVVTNTDNTGTHTDSTGQKGGGSATYQVCETGTSTCSSTITVVW